MRDILESFFQLLDGCGLPQLDLHHCLQPEVVKDLQVRTVGRPDNLRPVADHLATKHVKEEQDDFECGVRRGSILHLPVAVPPSPLGLLGVECFIT